MKNIPEYYEILEQSFERPIGYALKVYVKGPIVPEILNEAVQKAVQRYPYFAVKVERTEDDDISVVHNEEPIAVFEEGDGEMVFGSDAFNRHLMAVTYEKSCLYFWFLHALCDGMGCIDFAKTTLSVYFSKVSGKTIDAGGRTSADLKPSEEERTFFSYESLMGQDSMPLRKIKQGYAVSSEIKPSLIEYYQIKVPTKEFIRVKSFEDSPTSAAMVMLFRMQDRLIEDKESDIIGVVAHDYSAAVGCPGTTHNILRSLRVRYPRKVSEYDYEKLTVLTRGQLILEGLKERSIGEAREFLKYCDYIDGLHSFEEKRNYAIKNGRYIEKVDPSFMVSYAGRTDFGDLEEYVESFYPVTPAPFMIEVLTYRDSTYFCLSVARSINYYVPALLEELTMEKVSYSIEGPFNNKITKLTF